jgi:RNA polymerase sigma-70 factor, ECF subfamily
MGDFPTRTTTELLDGLARDGEQDLWTLFDRRYRRVIAGFVATSMRLNPDEAEEVAQATLVKFLLAYRAGKYKRGNGRLRSWLMGIAQNTAIDVLRSRARGEVDEQTPEREADDLWDRAQRASIAREAWELLSTSGQLEPRTLRAFELTVLRDVPTEAAAMECGMTPDAVYVAKTRVAQKLRTIESQLSEAYESDGV